MSTTIRVEIEDRSGLERSLRKFKKMLCPLLAPAPARPDSPGQPTP